MGADLTTLGGNITLVGSATPGITGTGVLTWAGGKSLTVLASATTATISAPIAIGAANVVVDIIVPNSGPATDIGLAFTTAVSGTAVAAAYNKLGAGIATFATASVDTDEFVNEGTVRGSVAAALDGALEVGQFNSVGNMVTSVSIVSGGSGYTAAPTATFSAPPTGGTTATTPTSGAAVTLSVATIPVATAGSGYTAAPSVIFTGGAGFGATAIATLSVTTGTSGVTFSSNGSGYTAAPTVVFSGGGGTGAVATAALGTGPTAGEVVSISVTSVGSGYTSIPSISFTGGGGSGAAATVTGTVTGVTVTNGGSGYSSFPSGFATFSGGGFTTAATIAATGAVTGTVTGVVIFVPGAGYTSAPTITFGAVTGATAAVATANLGVVAQVTANVANVVSGSPVVNGAAGAVGMLDLSDNSTNASAQLITGLQVYGGLVSVENVNGGLEITGTLTAAPGSGVTGVIQAANNLTTGNLYMSTATRQLTVADAYTTAGVDQVGLIINSVVSGAAGLGITKAGAGTLVLNPVAADGYTGVTTINEGTLQLGSFAGVLIDGNVVVGNNIGSANYTAGDKLQVLKLGASNQILNTATVTINDSGLLNLNNFSNTIGVNASTQVLAMTGGTILTGAVGALTLGGGASITVDSLQELYNGNSATIAGTVNAAGQPIANTGILNLDGVVRVIDVQNGALAGYGAASSDMVIATAISSGGLTKVDTGTLELSGTGTYTGLTTVGNGVLLVDGNIATSPVTVSTNGTLGGIGTVGVVTATGKVSPGDGTGTFGTLTASAVNLFGGGTLAISVGSNHSGTGYDVLNATGTTTLTGTATSGSAAITGLASTTDLFVGMGVSGNGIPTGATIATITSGTAITISSNATATVTGLNNNFAINNFTFSPPTLTGTTNGTTTISGLSSTANLSVGMVVSGIGIPAGDTIATIPSTTTLTLTTAAMASGTPSLTFTDPAVTLSSTTVNTSTTVTLVSTAGLTAGMGVLGTGIPLGDTIASVPTSTTITLTTAATSSATSLLNYIGTLTLTGTTTNNNAAISGLASTAGLLFGMGVSGTGIPTGATIAAITSGTSITITSNATASGTPSLTFSPINALTLGGTSILSVNLQGFSNTGGASGTVVTPITIVGNTSGTFSDEAATSPSAIVTSSHVTPNPNLYSVSANYANPAVIPLTIAPTTAPTVTVTRTSGTYNGVAFAATDSVSGSASLEGVTPTLAYYSGTSVSTSAQLTSAPSTVGTYTVLASFAGSTDYATASSTATTFSITAATPTVAVTDNSGTYTGLAFAATTDTVTGVSGSPQASLEGNTPGLTYYSGTSATGTALSGAPTTAGTYTVLASFASTTDYTSAAASTTFTIAQASPTVIVIDNGGTYTGSAFAATTDTVAGVGGSQQASLEGNTPGLTYYSGTSATGTALSGAPTTAGTYTVLASFASTTDYTSGLASTSFIINQAAPSLSLTDNSARRTQVWLSRPPRPAPTASLRA